MSGLAVGSRMWGVAAVAAVTLRAAAPGAALAQQAGKASAADRFAVADSIRAGFVRPPGSPPTDAVDVLELPFRIVGYPLNLLLVRLPAFLISELTAPRPPNAILRLYRSMSEWGLRPTLAPSIGGRSGLAAELQLTRFRPVYVSAAVSSRLSQRYRARVRLEGDAWRAETEVRWQRDAELEWHGIGARTREADRSFYRRDRFAAAATGALRAARPIEVVASVGYENNLVGDPVLADESLFEKFDAGGLFGATERTEFVRTGLGVTLDLTRWRVFQPRGVKLGATGELFEGVGGTDAEFHSLSAFVQGYLPLNDRQEFASRVVADLTRADAAAGIPFFHLASLGGTRSSRGFATDRFRDNDRLAVMNEWRYEIWRDLHDRMRTEWFVFFDYGVVARRLGDALGGGIPWHSSYGFGLRLATPSELLGVLSVGFNSLGEGVRFRIRSRWPF